MKILIIQPHSDDALLSCSRFLFSEQDKVRVLTIDNDPKRIKEDEAVGRMIGIKYISLGFDIQDNNDYKEFFKQFKGETLNDVNVVKFYSSRFGKRIKEFRTVLLNKIKHYINKGYVIVCPLGIGHPFHYFVRMQLRNLEDTFIFYKEFPHAYKRKALEQLQDEEKRIDLLLTGDDKEINTLKYEVAQKCYKSQSGFFFYEHGNIVKLHPEEYYTLKVCEEHITTKSKAERHIKIYVISKGRPDGKSFKHLRLCGQPYTVVVEPQDEEAYRKAGHENVLVLPENDRGVSYVMNYVKNLYDGTNPVVMMDDDILSWFYNLPNEPKISLSLKTAEEFKSFFEEMDKEICSTEFDVGTVGKSAFDWNTPDVSPKIVYPGSRSRYFTMAVVWIFNSNKLKVFDFDTTLKFKSDIDYSLKCMYLGFRVAKFMRYLQQTRMNKDGKQKGGLSETYQRTENLMEAQNIMLERWPDNVVIDTKKKPTNGVPELRTIYKVFDNTPKCMTRIQKLVNQL